MICTHNNNPISQGATVKQRVGASLSSFVTQIPTAGLINHVLPILLSRKAYARGQAHHDDDDVHDALL